MAKSKQKIEESPTEELKASRSVVFDPFSNLEMPIEPFEWPTIETPVGEFALNCDPAVATHVVVVGPKLGCFCKLTKATDWEPVDTEDSHKQIMTILVQSLCQKIPFFSQEATIANLFGRPSNYNAPTRELIFEITEQLDSMEMKAIDCYGGNYIISESVQMGEPDHPVAQLEKL